MIEISPTTGVMLYLCLTLATLLVFWCYQHYQTRNRKLDLAHHRLQVCEYCHFAYLEQVAKAVSRCPQCGSFNKEHS